MTDVITTRAANALIEDAELGLPAELKTVTPGLNFVEAVLAVVKRAYGGLWVGGRATLTTTSISFRPNAANRAVHKGNLSLDVPLSCVVDIEVLPGVLTRIVAIRTPHSVVKIRCFRADAFAHQIARQANATR